MSDLGTNKFDELYESIGVSTYQEVLEVTQSVVGSNPDQVTDDFRYFDNGSPKSLLGHILPRVGVSKESMLFHLGKGFNTKKARCLTACPSFSESLAWGAQFFLVHLQDAEDRGKTWQESLDHATNIVAKNWDKIDEMEAQRAEMWGVK